MTFEEVKTIMTNGIKNEEYKKSLIGYIECCEGLGCSIQETVDKINKIISR